MSQALTVLCNMLCTVSRGRRAIPVQAEADTEEKRASLQLSAF